MFIKCTWNEKESKGVTTNISWIRRLWGRNKEQKRVKIHTNTMKMARICPSYEQLNVNGLNSPVKTHRVKERI